ncbi:MAG: hypothetical protein JWN04_3679 [Myxococcaceae bacterium]|nr:hypothetical protein [Myxococcaceae bacterium]
MDRKVPRTLRLAVAALAFVAACEDSPLDAQVDAATMPALPLASGPAQQRAVPLTLGSALTAELSARAPGYLFAFTLSAPAAVSLRTHPSADGGVVDTVLRLSRIDQYGLPRVIGTSDDFEHSSFSGLDRTLSKGSYQVSVRGSTLRAQGAFTLASTCTGAGCPPLSAACLFGEHFSDLRTNPQLAVDSEAWIVDASQVVTGLMRDQVVLAVQQSAHTDVTTPAQALAAVDQNELRHMELHEQNGTRAFTAYEYGAGDNSYGAIFEQGTVTIAASIHDGDLLNCSVR